MSQLNQKIIAAVAKAKAKIGSLLVPDAKIQFKKGVTYDVNQSANIAQTDEMAVEGFFEKLSYEESKIWAPNHLYAKFVMFNSSSQAPAVDNTLLAGSVKGVVKSVEPTYVGAGIVLFTLIVQK